MATHALALIKRELLWIVASPRDLLYKVKKWTKTITLILSRCDVGNHQTMLESFAREDVLYDALHGSILYQCSSSLLHLAAAQAHDNNDSKICIHISQSDVLVQLEQHWLFGGTKFNVCSAIGFYFNHAHYVRSDK